ncbi:hypothetical protein [Streptomyces indicus]|nr:hypothetical protein [Streptomyces indicus]
MNDENRPRKPPTVTFEIETVDGEEGEALAREQAAVMIEVMTWIVEQRGKQNHATTPESD